MERREILGRFVSLFDGLKRAHGIYREETIGSTGKMSGKAQTVFSEVTPHLYASHLKGDCGIGIVPIREDNTCMFGAIDIDIYNNQISHVSLERQCKELGFPLVVCRSKSGGAHLFLFMAEPISAEQMRDCLGQMAMLLGHPGVEIFPKQINLASENDAGNWINIPYQNHEMPNRYAFFDGEPADLETFVTKAWDKRLTRQQFDNLNLEPPTDEMLEGFPPCLRSLAQQKISEGGRNSALFNFAVGCRQKWPDSWEDKLVEMNQIYFSPPLPNNETQTIIKSIGGKEYFYTCEQTPIVNFCNKSLCRKAQFGISGETLASMAPIYPEALQKILTNPPTWVVTVEGQRFECSTDTLLDQNRFRKIVVEQLNKIPGKVKNPTWERKIQAVLAAVEEIEAPPEADLDGMVIHHTEEFLTERQQAKSKDELLNGLPWTEDGRTYFRAADLQKYLKVQQIQIKPSEVWKILRNSDLDITDDQFTIAGKKVRVWGVTEIAREKEPEHDNEEDLPIPEVPKDSF